MKIKKDMKNASRKLHQDVKNKFIQEEKEALLEILKWRARFGQTLPILESNFYENTAIKDEMTLVSTLIRLKAAGLSFDWLGDSPKIKIAADDSQLGEYYDSLESQCEEIKNSVKSRVLGKFPTPLNAKWEDFTIKLLDAEYINVSTKGINKKYNYIEVGFKDNRKSSPDKQWEILKELIENNGEIDCHYRTRKYIEKYIQIIRSRLRILTGIKSDPFEKFKKTHIKKEYKYKAKFSVVNASFGNSTKTVGELKLEEESEIEQEIGRKSGDE